MFARSNMSDHDTIYSTCYESATHPLHYADNTLVQRGDYVICFSEENNRITHATYARVWDTLYYDNGLPIGTVLIDANHSTAYVPEFSIFDETDSNGNKKFYFRTQHTYDQNETANFLYPLIRKGNYLKIWQKDKSLVKMELFSRKEVYPNPEDFTFQVFYQTVLQRAQEGDATCLFTMALWQQEKHRTDKAIRFYQAAAEKHNANAWLELGFAYDSEDGILEHNPEKAMRCFKQAAEYGNRFGQYLYALYFINGNNNIQQSDAEALYWLHKSAEQDFAPACLKLGLYHHYGSFNYMRPKNSPYRRTNPIQEAQPEIAASMFAKAARQKWKHTALAKFHLAECYRNGWGVNEDSNEAMRLYCEAVVEGDIQHEEIQAAIYHTGNVELLGMIADNGHIYAAYLLGRSYWHGEHGQKDRVVGRRYLRMAAESGHECATEAAQLLLEKEDNSWASSGGINSES